MQRALIEILILNEACGRGVAALFRQSMIADKAECQDSSGHAAKGANRRHYLTLPLSNASRTRYRGQPFSAPPNTRLFRTSIL